MGTDIHDHSLPAVIRTCAAAIKAGEENPCKLNLLVFKAGLQRSTARREQRVLQNAHEVQKNFVEHVFSQPDELLSEQLGPMKLVHIFGAKRGCEWVGSEPNCVGSLKAYMVKPSSVMTIILPLASVVKFSVDSGASCTSFFEL